MMWQNYFMASISLSDAYYSVPVALTNQKYLLSKFEDNYTDLFACPMAYPLHQELSLNY